MSKSNKTTNEHVYCITYNKLSSSGLRKQINSPLGDEGGQHKLTYEWMSEIKIASINSSYNCLSDK